MGARVRRFFLDSKKGLQKNEIMLGSVTLIFYTHDATISFNLSGRVAEQKEKQQNSMSPKHRKDKGACVHKSTSLLNRTLPVLTSDIFSPVMTTIKKDCDSKAKENSDVYMCLVKQI